MVGKKVRGKPKHIRSWSLKILKERGLFLKSYFSGQGSEQLDYWAQGFKRERKTIHAPSVLHLWDQK